MYSSLQDRTCRINNYFACMSWYESHYPGEISLCALLPCLGNAGQLWFSCYPVFWLYIVPPFWLLSIMPDSRECCWLWMRISSLFQYLFGWVRLLMSLDRLVVQRQSLVFKPTQPQFFLLLVTGQNWPLRSINYLFSLCNCHFSSISHNLTLAIFVQVHPSFTNPRRIRRSTREPRIQRRTVGSHCK